MQYYDKSLDFATSHLMAYLLGIAPMLLGVHIIYVLYRKIKKDSMFEIFLFMIAFCLQLNCHFIMLTVCHFHHIQAKCIMVQNILNQYRDVVFYCCLNIGDNMVRTKYSWWTSFRIKYFRLSIRFSIDCIHYSWIRHGL